MGRVFDTLAKEFNDPIPLKDLGILYYKQISPNKKPKTVQRMDTSKNILFLSKKRTKEEILAEFEGFFLQKGRDSVSRPDFIQYYEEQSLSFSSESSFIEMVERSWGISENEDSQKDHLLITGTLMTIRTKLLEKLKENATFENVMKLFMSFDVQTSFSLTFFEFQNAMKRMQINIEEKMLGRVFKRIDLNNSGFIEFPEFFNFVTGVEP